MAEYKLLKDYTVINVTIKKGSKIEVDEVKAAALMRSGFIAEPKAPAKAEKKEIQNSK